MGLFVHCAGNDGGNLDSGYTEISDYRYIDKDNVIVVGASDQNDNLADFSNYGATSVDLFAPGVNILTTTANSGYVYVDGTSFATPMVAGTAALILSLYPDMPTAVIKQAILDGVDNGFDGLCVTGGRLNVYNALINARLAAEAELCTVTYLDGGGGAFSGTHGGGSTPHTYGAATNLVAPTRAGYVFGGWFLTDTCNGTPLTSLSATGYTANITLYAKWTLDLSGYELFEFYDGILIYATMLNPTSFVIVFECGGWYDLNVGIRGGGNYIACDIFDASGAEPELLYSFDGDYAAGIAETVYMEAGVPYLVEAYGDGNFAFTFELFFG
jgi:uncharacterized repeat protein (TIGR02543 family)